MNYTEKFLAENQQILERANQRLKNKGYDMEKAQKVAFDYINTAKSYDLNQFEFSCSLDKAKELVNQAFSKSSLPSITSDEANE